MSDIVLNEQSLTEAIKRAHAVVVAAFPNVAKHSTFTVDQINAYGDEREGAPVIHFAAVWAIEGSGLRELLVSVGPDGAVQSVRVYPISE